MNELPPLRETIAKYELRAKKALGQNFLLDGQLLDRIAAIPGNLNGELVYEVGPGPGGLTRALLSAGAEVIAVERDRRCILALAETAEHFGRERLTIVEDDALSIDERALLGDRGAHIVANLPYNVGTALFTRWLTEEPWPPWWRSLTLMFQQEVAERIVAQPGTGAYGRLSILAQWRSAAEIAMKVHRSAFVPPPKVMSAIVHLRPAKQPPGVPCEAMEKLTKITFGKRRKMLRQSLKDWPEAIAAMKKIEIDSMARPETLSIADFVALAREIGSSRD